ncbi:hypothetical protein RUM43_008999 [Polyplax serrata]|uniref:Pro-resilin n=1 Tax=Polyplax serrata TaxID=468196 RepID=A0AAN8S8B5_POLSC
MNCLPQTYVCCIVLAVLGAALAEPPTNGYLPPQAGNRNFGSGGSGYPGSGSGSGFGGGYSSGGSGFGRGGDDGPSEPANYEFRYDVKDAESGNDFGHMESRKGDFAQGRYYVLLPDGRTLIVSYTADENGYQPEIKYEGEARQGGAGGYGGSGAGGYSNGGYSNGGGAGGFGGNGGHHGGSGSYDSSSGYRY